MAGSVGIGTIAGTNSTSDVARGEPGWHKAVTQDVYQAPLARTHQAEGNFWSSQVF